MYMVYRVANMTDKYIWRVKSGDMETLGVLVTGSGVKEVIKKG